jgi:hypothetical protein
MRILYTLKYNYSLSIYKKYYAIPPKQKTVYFLNKIQTNNQKNAIFVAKPKLYDNSAQKE